MGEFSLVDEPWILVKKPDLSVSEVSIMDLFSNAHNINSLAGETKAQDFAVLRMLLAIMYTAYQRYGLDGNQLEAGSADTKAAWESMWKDKKIAIEPIKAYLNQWHDRFWLIDKDHPFLQSNFTNGKGSMLATGKLIGTIVESGNKKRFSATRHGEERILSYAEATRWLININCFDDIAAKKPTPKRTWVSRLGLVAAQGENLAETLLINYHPLLDAGKEEKIYEVPSWEYDNNNNDYNNLTKAPKDQAGLLSFVSRSVYLKRENGKVIGYYISGGNYFEEEDVFAEQMTLWRSYKEDKDVKYKPRTLGNDRALWRYFGDLFNDDEETKVPGIIERLEGLAKDGLISDKNVKIVSAGVIYDIKQAASLPVMDVVSDDIKLNPLILTDEETRKKTAEEIEKCNKAAYALSKCIKEILYCLGKRGQNASSQEEEIKDMFYFAVDRPVRKLISAKETDTDTAVKEFEKEVKDIVFNDLFDYIIPTGSMNIIIGDGTHSVAKAVNILKATINNIFAADDADNKTEGE